MDFQKENQCLRKRKSRQFLRKSGRRESRGPQAHVSRQSIVFAGKYRIPIPTPTRWVQVFPDWVRYSIAADIAREAGPSISRACNIPANSPWAVLREWILKRSTPGWGRLKRGLNHGAGGRSFHRSQGLCRFPHTRFGHAIFQTV